MLISSSTKVEVEASKKETGKKRKRRREKAEGSSWTGTGNGTVNRELVYLNIYLLKLLLILCVSLFSNLKFSTLVFNLRK